jgi:hypothetical protein
MNNSVLRFFLSLWAWLLRAVRFLDRRQTHLRIYPKGLRSPSLVGPGEKVQISIEWPPDSQPLKLLIPASTAPHFTVELDQTVPPSFLIVENISEIPRQFRACVYSREGVVV